MKTWEIALHEMRRVFGADYTTDLLMDEAFNDKFIHDFDALDWSEETRRAEVWLPEMGPVPFVALGRTRRCPELPEPFQVWYHWCGGYVEVPQATYWGIKCLRNIHDDACKVLQVLGWAADEEGPDEYSSSDEEGDGSSSEDCDEAEDNSEESDASYKGDVDAYSDNGDQEIRYVDFDDCSDFDSIGSCEEVSSCDDCSCSDCDEESDESTTVPAVAAYRLARNEHGVGYALQMAIEELPDAAHSYFSGFTWNNLTQQPEVRMLDRDGSVLRVPVVHLGAVYEDPDARKMVALRTTRNDELVAPDEETARGLEYLLDLERAARAAENGAAVGGPGGDSTSPTDGAVSEDSASGSPGRVSTTRSTSPTAATSITEPSYTASTAACADTMNVHKLVGHPQPTFNANYSSPRTVTVQYWVKVEPIDHDAELLHADDTDDA